jgi:hypothetical protein
MDRDLGGLLAFALAACPLSCSDTRSAPTASAAPEPPRPCAEVTQDERVERCRASETPCCSTMMRDVKKTDPDYADKLWLACAGADETSCQHLRDGPYDAAKKVDALDKACTKIGRWTCRTAAMLGLVATPDRAGKLIENYCRQTDDTSFRAAATSIRCDEVGPAELATFKDDATRCGDGDLAACKRLADIDGGAMLLYERIAWEKRGIDADQARKERVRLYPLPEEERGKGRVAITVKDAGGLDQGKLESSLEDKRDALRKCVASSLAADEKPRGKLALALTVDKSGRAAFVTVDERATKGMEAPELVACVRWTLQDAELAPAGGSVGKAAVSLEVSP